MLANNAWSFGPDDRPKDKWVPFIFQNKSNDPESAIKDAAWEIEAKKRLIRNVSNSPDVVYTRRIQAKIHRKKSMQFGYSFDRSVTNIIDIIAIKTLLNFMGLRELYDFSISGKGIDFFTRAGAAQFELFFSQYIFN